VGVCAMNVNDISQLEFCVKFWFENEHGVRLGELTGMIFALFYFYCLVERFSFKTVDAERFKNLSGTNVVNFWRTYFIQNRFVFRFGLILILFLA
jgi:hypothetical protein